ncbi:MAG: helix-turn-helix transcriptional regulator [Nocardioides sp.]
MLVGRQKEQRAIDALLAGARLGQGGTLVLVGAAGIGKSALLRYAESQARGLRLLRVTGAEAEQDLPFAGLAQLLRPLVGGLEGLPPPQAEALSVALALRQGEPVERFAVSAAVLSLVTRAAEDAPLGLIIDDAHLIDRPSAESIAFTCRRLLADAVVALVAGRPETDVDVWSGLPHLTLDGLGDDAAGQVAAASSPAPLDEHLRDIAVALGQGNPLALQALARDPARLATASPGVPVPVPTVIAEDFARRADALDERDRPVLLVAAVAEGDLAVTRRVGDAIGLDPRALERAESLGLLLILDDRLSFPHPLARSATYADASPGERRRLHRLVATALPVGDPDRRAWHAAAAVVGPDGPVADGLERVAERATNRGAHAVAATAHERAARLSPGDRERSRRLLAAGRASWLAGDDRRALALLGEVTRHDASPTLAARAMGLEGLVAARGGSLRQARDKLFAAAVAVEPTDPDLALMTYADTVDVCFYLLDTRTAVAAADRAERLLGRRAPSPSPVPSAGPAAVASIAVGMARIVAGEPGADRIRSGLTMIASADFTEPGVQSAWEVLGPLFLRESGTGRDLVAQALERRRSQAAIGTLPHLLFHVARDDATTDRWSRAAAGYGEAITLARELGQTTELGASLAGLTWLTARQGRVEEARALATEAQEVADAHDSLLASSWVRFAAAELDLSLGDVAAATSGFMDLVAWLDDLAVLDVDLSPVPELVEALCRSGRQADARAASTSYLGRAKDKGQPWSLARAARVRGLLATGSAAEACFEEALACHEQTLDTFEAARTRLLLGARLRRSRRRVDARVHLRTALETFECLGAQLWGDVALTELNATGLTSQRRGPGSIAGLTARELQIAQLVTEGRTTRETAAALFLSPKTVEYHLRHVYMKLDIGSRGELADRLGDAPG